MKKEFIISCSFIIVALVVYGLFPTNNNFQNIAASIFFLGLLPIIYCLLVVKKPLSEIGITQGKLKEGVLWSFVSLVFALPIFYLLLSYTDFSQNYNLVLNISSGFLQFLQYELLIVLPFVILYEIFFRGFSMLFLKKNIGYAVVIVQAALFCLFLIFTGSFGWYFAPYIIFSLFSGLIAYKSGSIYYSTLAHLIFIIIVDASIIKVLQ